MSRPTSDIFREAIESPSLETYTRFVGAIRPIYGATPNGTPCHIGSCVLIQGGQHRFLITAAHISDEYKVSRLYVGGECKTVELPPEGLMTSMPLMGRGDDHLDFSFFRLDETACMELGRVGFIGPDELHPNDCATRNTYYVCVGYPSSKNRQLSVADTTLSPARWRYTSNSVADEKYQTLGMSKDSHVVLKFDESRMQTPEGERVNAPSPKGMSGGGIFRLREVFQVNSTVSTSKTDGRLVGILIEKPFKRKGKVIVAVRISLVLAAIVARFPELDAVFPSSTRLEIRVDIPQ